MIMSLAIALAVAQAPLSGAAASAQAAEEDEVRARNCRARKFETIIVRTVAGRGRASKLTLCGKEGQSDSEWAATLQDAIAKANANPAMAPEVREQIVTAINAELAKLAGSAVAAPAEPAPVLTEAAPAGAPAAPTPAPPPAEPLPAPVAAPVVPAPPTATRPTPVRPAAQAMPRVTLHCSIPGELSRPAPCTGLERETLFTLLADSDVPQGTTLRFLRRGDPRAALAIGSLRPGQSVRVALPRAVCAGVAQSRVEIQLVSGGATATIAGPLTLRC